MPLTVTEKEHWKDRIARRIDRKIENLKAAEPGLIDRIKRDARRQALRSLGLAERQARLDEIEQEKERLGKEERQVQRAMQAHLRGVPVEDVDDYTPYRADQEVSQAVVRRQAVHKDELLAEHEIGREILRLREERDNLLDTVWLASSPTQIRTLWSKVAELLGELQTRLEQEALAIEPVQDA